MVELGKSSVYSEPGVVDPELEGIDAGDSPLTEAEVRDRAERALAEEIRLMLDEGVVRAVQDVDLCMLLGAGLAVLAGRHLRAPGPHRRRRGGDRQAVPAQGRRRCPPDPQSRRPGFLNDEGPAVVVAVGALSLRERSPVSSKVFRSLRTHGQPPPPISPNSLFPDVIAARDGMPASSWVTVKRQTPSCRDPRSPRSAD